MILNSKNADVLEFDLKDDDQIDQENHDLQIQLLDQAYLLNKQKFRIKLLETLLISKSASKKKTHK